MNKLPEDLFLILLDEYLEEPELKSMAGVCRSFNKHATGYLYEAYNGDWEYPYTGPNNEYYSLRLRPKLYWPFLRTLLLNPSRARLVKRITLRASKDLSRQEILKRRSGYNEKRFITSSADDGALWERSIEKYMKHLDDESFYGYGPGSDAKGFDWDSDVAEVALLLTLLPNVSMITFDDAIRFLWADFLKKYFFYFFMNASHGWKKLERIEFATPARIKPNELSYMLGLPKLGQLTRIAWIPPESRGISNPFCTPRTSKVQNLSVRLDAQDTAFVNSLVSCPEKLVQCTFYGPTDYPYSADSWTLMDMGRFTELHADTLHLLDLDWAGYIPDIVEGGLLPLVNLRHLHLQYTAMFAWDEDHPARTFTRPALSKQLPPNLISFEMSGICGPLLFPLLTKHLDEIRTGAFPNIQRYQLFGWPKLGNIGGAGFDTEPTSIMPFINKCLALDIPCRCPWSGEGWQLTASRGDDLSYNAQSRANIDRHRRVPAPSHHMYRDLAEIVARGGLPSFAPANLPAEALNDALATTQEASASTQEDGMVFDMD